MPAASWHEPLLQVPVTPLPPPVQLAPLAWHMFPTQQPPALHEFAAQQRCPSPPQVAPEEPPALLEPPVPTAVLPAEPAAWPPVPGTDVPPVPVVGAVPPLPELLLLLEQAPSAARAAIRYHAACGAFEPLASRDRCGE